jgi:hypothetical protein
VSPSTGSVWSTAQPRWPALNSLRPPTSPEPFARTLSGSSRTSQLPANLICKFDLSGRLRGDTSQRYAAYVQGWQTGFLNQDEIRAMEDLPPMPNGLGQTYYGPLNFAPLGTPRAPVNTTGPTVGQGVGGAVGASSGDQTGPNDAAQQNKAAEEMILRILAEAGHSV